MDDSLMFDISYTVNTIMVLDLDGLVNSFNSVH